jgi:hypothetical protein
MTNPGNAGGVNPRRAWAERQRRRRAERDALRQAVQDALRLIPKIERPQPDPPTVEPEQHP